MSLAILGIGTAVPPTVINQKEAAGIAASLCCRTTEHRTWLPVMYQHTGIQTRHLQFGTDVVRDIIEGRQESGSCFLPNGTDHDPGPTTRQRMDLYRQQAGGLAKSASRTALDSAKTSADEVTHLVTVSCTGFHAPGVDVELIQSLSLRPDVARTHIGFMGCHGALNGLRVARAFAAEVPTARILVCATELCSLHYQFGWDPGKMIANALFGDGAAAIIAAAASSQPAWQLLANGSFIMPETMDAMTWAIGDHGFEMSLSKEVPHLIGRHLRPWLTSWLASRCVAIQDVGSWAIHPGGPRILDAVEEGLGLDSETTAISRDVFSNYGNMSSPTILFILDRLMQQNAAVPCVALGFGPGMTVEAALLGRV